MRRLPPLSRTGQNLRPGVFAELGKRIEERVRRGEEVIPLHIGDTAFPPPVEAHLARVLRELGEDDAPLYRYGATQGLTPFLEAIAERASSRYREHVHPDEVLIGSGGTHALACTMRAIVDPGDEVLLCSPYWPLIHGIVAQTGARSVEVPLSQELYRDPSIDIGARLREKLTPRTRAVYFVSPNNPDGKVMTVAAMEAIAEFAREHDIWVIADEVYADLALDRAHTSFGALTDVRDRTVLAYSFSKSHALAGLRLGYVIAPVELVMSARRASVYSVFNVPVAMQRAGLGALSAPPEYTEGARAFVREARDRVVDLLRQGPFRFHVPEGATYVFLDASPVLGGRPLVDLLSRALDAGVLLAPGESFGHDFGSFARLCVTSAPTERVLEGTMRLLEVAHAFGA